MFILNRQELVTLRWYFATSNASRRGTRYEPKAFSESKVIIKEMSIDKLREMKQKIILIIFIISLTLTPFDVWGLHIIQEDIDGTGPDVLINAYWTLFLISICILCIIGYIIWSLFEGLWVLLERLMGYKRTYMITAHDAMIAHTIKDYKMFYKLTKRLRLGRLTKEGAETLNKLTTDNYVFKVKYGRKVNILKYYPNGMCCINLYYSDTSYNAAELYVNYKDLRPYERDEFSHD